MLAQYKYKIKWHLLVIIPSEFFYRWILLLLSNFKPLPTTVIEVLHSPKNVLYMAEKRVKPIKWAVLGENASPLISDNLTVVNVWGKRFKLPQLTHEGFLTIDPSCKIFFWYLPNWTSTDLWCVVLYVAYSTTHQRLVEVQFGRYQKNILQEWSMVKKLSCVSCGSFKHFPHTFTSNRLYHILQAL